MNKILLSVVLLICFGAIAYSQNDSISFNRSFVPAPLPATVRERAKWEYKVINTSGPMQDVELNKLGNEGWQASREGTKESRELDDWATKTTNLPIEQFRKQSDRLSRAKLNVEKLQKEIDAIGTP